MPGRAAAVLIPALLLVAPGMLGVSVMWSPLGYEARGVQRYEFHPPFRMVWVEEDARGDRYTVELMWRGYRSWSTVLRASSAEPHAVGRIGTWDGVTLTEDDPVGGRQTYRPELTVNAPLVPAPWVLAWEYPPDDGWEALGPDADGNERFRKTETREGRTRTIVRTRHADAPLTIASTTMVDGKPVTSIRVVELEVQQGPAYR